MTNEQIAALDDEAARDEAARVSGYKWDQTHGRGWYVLGALGRGWVVEGEEGRYTIYDGSEGIAAVGAGTMGDAARAFLRHYYAGRISLPGRPAWAPVLERLQAAGFYMVVRRVRADSLGCTNQGMLIGKAFRIAMEGMGDD